MLVLSFKFPAGRYHATPWDRHVNEGAVAWPPEPWRILRALIATWHHKVKWTAKHAEATVLKLIESLAQELPEYTLPPATHSHTRHYMPQFAAGDTKLVFDAFAAVNREDALTVIWPTLDLPEEQAALLDDLLAVMGYLGRTESWVEAQRLDKAPEIHGAIKCKPGSNLINQETGELHGEAITMLASRSVSDYKNVRGRFLTDRHAITKLSSTLPDNLLDALSLETADLRKQGWSQPPAAHKVSYLRPVDALRPRRVTHRPATPRITTAGFIVIGKPLPRVEDSLHIGELLRQAVMSKAKWKFGEDNIPSIFSGHGMPYGNRHSHAFYLPWDANRDGRIDRLMLHVPGGMTAEQCRVVESLNYLKSRDGSEWQLVLEHIADIGMGGLLTQAAAIWQSVTPYLHPWHAKKNFRVQDQIRRECRDRAIPEPTNLEQIDEVLVGNRKRRPIHFHRFRNKRGISQPDRLGTFWRLTFPEAVHGPIALGFACHFGLGLFRPS